MKILVALLVLPLSGCALFGWGSDKRTIESENLQSSLSVGEAKKDIASARGKIQGAAAQTTDGTRDLLSSADDDLSDAIDHLDDAQDSARRIGKSLTGVTDRIPWGTYAIVAAGLALLVSVLGGMARANPAGRVASMILKVRSIGRSK